MIDLPGHRRLYTLGSSTRSLAEFLELLRGWHITLLVDIRRFPASRFQHFCEERLERALADAGINYASMGESLGGYRKGGYENYMLTAEFAAALSTLENLARQQPTAIMCSERLPWRCHRRSVGQALAARGWRVIHIIEADRTWEPKEPG